MNTKKKTIITIVSILCGIILAAVIVMAISPVKSNAETLINASIEDAEVSTLPQIQNSAHIQEGYGSAEVWQQILLEEKNAQILFGKALLADYDAYFTDNEKAEINSLLEKVNIASTIAEISPYEVALAEKQTMVIARYDEAQAQAIAEAEQEAAEQEALAAQEVVYDNYYNNYTYDNSYNYSTTGYDYSTSYSSSSSTSDATWSGDSSSAKAWIVERESGGSYTATNGRYYGAYQLDISYLNGDLSAENQDAVAEEYVNSRYGGWEGAVSFWQTNGWY